MGTTAQAFVDEQSTSNPAISLHPEKHIKCGEARS